MQYKSNRQNRNNKKGFRSKKTNSGFKTEFKHSKHSNYNSQNRSHFSRNNRHNSGEQIPIAKFINKAKVQSENNEEIYQPVNSINDFNIYNALKSNLHQKGFVVLTPIQDQAIPHILEGKDLIGIASTGTGKTFAFLIPLINKVINDPSQKVLIIAPTRELALQIEGELNKISNQLGLTKTVCIGGASMSKQIGIARRNPDFIIGTPGRIKDLIERGVIRIKLYNNIVLDEVDRMLDMGFVAIITEILGMMPEDRQSLFFSATVDQKVTNLIKKYSQNPITVKIESRETAETVEQDIVKILPGRDKFSMLIDMLKKAEFQKILIFGRTKFGVKKLEKMLNEKGYKAESIHGNKSQSQREKALKYFKDDRASILVATDIAARGLDIPNVSHVINYDLPATYEDYIHRIGRTGRANKIGKALTFVNSERQ